MMNRASFGVLVLEGLLALHRHVQLQFLLTYGWGIDFDYCDVELFALEMTCDHFTIFEVAPKYCISNSFVDYEGYSISSKGFLPIVIDAMVNLIKFANSLIYSIFQQLP